jgi:hypothetical protein
MCEQTEVSHLPKPLYYCRVHPHSILGAKQLQQVYFAHQAIQNALQRRGLADTYELEVRVQSKFFLKEKT